MVHECLDPTVEDKACVIKNSEAVREVIKQSGKVKMVIQGHYHRGNEIMIDEIPYIALKGVCEAEENPYRIMEI